uniref:Uncharacterized protein n=1 Tax=Lotharella oceanica TaxID=641309 RepID=A0A7S2TVX7_9EUKA|mmetsp:Transcript_32418/g.60289  ORF Transcript_32418/g.60289 Transcript_32418/m.60289 type:complete len:375 (+) Transcript_32418:7-1131(+)
MSGHGAALLGIILAMSSTTSIFARLPQTKSRSLQDPNPSQKLALKKRARDEIGNVIDTIESATAVEGLQGATDKVLDNQIIHKPLKPSEIEHEVCGEEAHGKCEDPKEERDEQDVLEQISSMAKGASGEPEGEDEEEKEVTTTEINLPDVRKLEVPPEDWAGMIPISGDVMDDFLKSQKQMENVHKIRYIIDGYIKSVLPMVAKKLNKTLVRKKKLTKSLRALEKAKSDAAGKNAKDEETFKKHERSHQENLDGLQKAVKANAKLKLDLEDLIKKAKDAEPHYAWRVHNLINMYKQFESQQPRLMIVKCEEVRPVVHMSVGACRPRIAQCTRDAAPCPLPCVESIQSHWARGATVLTGLQEAASLRCTGCCLGG